MDKETSSRVSGLAAAYMQVTGEKLVRMTADDMEGTANDIRTLAGSALSQDQTPGQVTGKAGESFIDRLNREAAELSGRIDALSLFIQRGRMATGVSKLQWAMLTVQLDAMRAYQRILNLRLADLTENDNGK